MNYAYDAARRVTGVTVSHNTTSDACDVTYTFAYDALGRKTTVKVGSQTLLTNVYGTDRSGLLSEVQYGNGGKVKYTYDGFDRLTGYDGHSGCGGSDDSVCVWRFQLEGQADFL